MSMSEFKRVVAAGLVLTMFLVTMPVSAAELSTPKTVIGSVSAVGPVQLRGIDISQEGTLFAGDTIRSGQKGYAKVLLGNAGYIGLAQQTGVTVHRDSEGVKVAMNTGTLGFTARKSLRIDISPFEVTAADNASGNVVMFNSTTAGIRATTGKVTIRNLKTSESFVLAKGQDLLLSLNGSPVSLAEIASNAPAPVPAGTPAPVPTPAPAPQTPPAAKTSGGWAMDTGGWLAVFGVAGLAGVAIWGIANAVDKNNEIDELNARIKQLTAASASRP